MEEEIHMPRSSQRAPLAPIRYLKGKFSAIQPVQVNFSMLEIFYWAVIAAPAMLTVFLQHKGLTTDQIGPLMAFMAFVNILSPPFWGMISDKIRSAKKVFILCLAVGAVVWATAPFLLNYVPLMILMWVVFPLSRFFYGATSPILDSWLMRIVQGDSRLSYGIVRMFGAVGYSTISVLYTLLVSRFPMEIIFFGFLVLAVPTIFFAARIPDVHQSKKSLSLKEMQFGRLLKNAPFLLYIVFNILLYIPINASFSFLPFVIEGVGADPAMFSAISGLKSLMEIPIFLFSGRLLRRFKPTTLMVVAACLFTLETLLYPFCQNVVQIFVVQCVHGSLFALYLSCQIQHVHSLAPPELSATAQTLNGASSALSGIIGNLFGGYMIAATGIRTFYLLASGIQVVAVLFFLLTLYLNKRKQPPLSAQS